MHQMEKIHAECPIVIYGFVFNGENAIYADFSTETIVGVAFTCLMEALQLWNIF